MSFASFLLWGCIALPLAMAAASALLTRPARWLAVAAAPGLLCALAVPIGTAAEWPDALLGIGLALDATGAVFLGLCAFLWLCAGAYAAAYLAGQPHQRSFCVFWQLTLAGSLGSCVAADAVSFYLAFSLLSLAAYGLVIHERGAEALRAGRIYIALALVGELALLVGLLLAAQAAGSILMADMRAALADAPWRIPALVALVAGLGLKAGLVPLHGWLPLAHAHAPVPASAVLSGAIVKAGLLGLVRFLPLEAPWPDAAQALAWAGVLTAWAGIVLGLPQLRPKAVLAYSTMSQMGLAVAVLAAGWATVGASTAQAAATFYALHHGLAKGALFLGVGLLAWPGARRLALGLGAVLGAALAGLPLTGGALAKLAAKGAMGSEGALALLASLAALGTMLLMLRWLALAAREPVAHAGERAPRAMTLAFLAVAAAGLVAPWLLFPALDAQRISDAWKPAALWAALWPLAGAAVLALFAWRRRGPWPQVPLGDIAAWAEGRLQAAGRHTIEGLSRRQRRGWAPRAPERLLRAVEGLSTWPAGASMLVAVALLLALVL